MAEYGVKGRSYGKCNTTTDLPAAAEDADALAAAGGDDDAAAVDPDDAAPDDAVADVLVSAGGDSASVNESTPNDFGRKRTPIS